MTQATAGIEKFFKTEDRTLRIESDGRKRVLIEGVSPEVDGGRFPAKRTVGDIVKVEADIFTDGHDAISAVIRVRHESSPDWVERPLRALVNDRWTGDFSVTELGRYRYTFLACVDHWETWLRDLRKRITAENDSPLDYLMGAEHIEHAAERATGADRTWLTKRTALLRNEENLDLRRANATDADLNEIMLRYPDRSFATEYGRELVIVVDPVRARFSAWYELFPRSASQGPGRHGTFADCETRLPYIAGMGFDVVYLPPIHPIGTKFRKGKNNNVKAEPGDVGSPWAIGAQEGGH
ncbi:MAG: DUF3416 domain-containing protein, partial [Acidobacteriota bacterium]|nr:DUF3416 domain-containing protein [Acidobacteriota bacterium]